MIMRTMIMRRKMIATSKHIIHLNSEKTMSEILCSSSLLGWITARDINHS